MEIEDFIKQLQLKGYSNENAFVKTTKEVMLELLEKDAERVFRFWFGEGEYKNSVKMWQHHYAQAHYEREVGIIKSTIHYIIVNEKIRLEHASKIN